MRYNIRSMGRFPFGPLLSQCPVKHIAEDCIVVPALSVKGGVQEEIFPDLSAVGRVILLMVICGYSKS